MGEPQSFVGINDPVQAVESRAGIKEGRVPLLQVFNMGVAEKDNVGITHPCFPLEMNNIMVNTKLITMDNHQTGQPSFKQSDPFHIEAAGQIDIAADAHHRNIIRNFHMK